MLDKRFFLGLSVVCGLAWSAQENDYLRWRLLGQERIPDGGNQLRFALESPAERLPWDTLEIIYSSTPMRRPGSPDMSAPPEIHRKKIAPDESTLVLYSGRPESIELNARAEKDGQTYYARTLVYAYGESGRSDPESERLEFAPPWPGFGLIASGGRYFRAQPGGEVSVQTRFRPARVEIFDDGKLAATLPTDEEGRYRHTPADDPKIQKTWRVSKSLVFAGEMPDERARFTFYLPVFRGYYRQIDYRSGLLVLIASALVALAGVLWQGRKFPWR